MSDTNDTVSLHQKNHTLEHLFHALDPVSLILNQNSHSQPFPLRLTTAESFIMERGPRYKAYAELRETKLRKRQQQEQKHDGVVEQKKGVTTTTPPRKQVKFQGNLGPVRKGCSSILAQSVPDFTAALKKENKKPVNNSNALLPSLMEMTPPMKSFCYKGSNNSDSGSRGSKSASAAGEKKVASLARKSYASIDELKGLSSATAKAIIREGRGGRSRGVMGKSVSGYYRQF